MNSPCSQYLTKPYIFNNKRSTFKQRKNNKETKYYSQTNKSNSLYKDSFSKLPHLIQKYYQNK